ncbi:MAG: hypothetical protein FJ217_15765 [Ignavibacteria bacterium]|nr:hypothetical protein [Ignavibacteria bacterium]
MPDRLKDTVTIAGRATVASGVLHRERLTVFLQDHSGGIQLFAKQLKQPISLGDSVIATGIVGQYNGLTQLVVRDYLIVDTLRWVPEPLAIDLADAHSERYEGMLVKVQGKIINKRTNKGGTYLLITQPEESDEILAVFVADYHHPKLNLDGYSVGDEIEVVGLLGQYDFDPPYREYYQIYPRYEDDIRSIGITRATYYTIAAVGGMIFVIVLLSVIFLRREVRKGTRQLKGAEEQLRSLSKHLLAVQEEERRRISRDLHDGLGQLLTSTCLDLERAIKADQAAKKNDLVSHALRAARQALEEVGELSSLLRPWVIDELGLREAIETYVSEFESRTHLKVYAKLDFKNSDVPDVIATNVYRILQEALNNAYKHSSTKTVTVDVSCTRDDLLLRVQDQGNGFQVELLNTRRTFGVLGMRERAELLGGSLHIYSAPGHGTEVLLRIPINNRSHSIRKNDGERPH